MKIINQVLAGIKVREAIDLALSCFVTINFGKYLYKYMYMYCSEALFTNDCRSSGA